MAVSEEIQEQVLAEATSATPNYSVDYNDEKIVENNNNYQNQLTDMEETYGGIIGSTDQYYKDLSDKMEERVDKLAQVQQDNTDFAIEKIEQEKDKARKDYLKEQSGAYVDWQKQSNQYGVNAEKMAAAGLDKSGYSESSQVDMYNTYQNRVATARESLNNIIMNYNNNIKEAQLQNNAALAQLYADLSVQQMELALQGFQYKNQLVLELSNKKIELENNRWQRELALIEQQNWEKQMAEQRWQYEDNQAWQTDQAQKDRDQAKALQEDAQKFEADQAQIDREHDEKMAQINYEYEDKLLKAKTAEEKKIIAAQRDAEIAIADAEYERERKQLASSANISAIGSVAGVAAASKNAAKITGSSSSGSKSSSSKSSSVSSSKSSSSTGSVNMASVLALGYGPISASRLAELVNQGKVKLVKKNGVTYAEKVVSSKSLR